MFSHESEDGSGSHCHGSWRLGPLIDMYTTPRCRALFHLDPVAKFGKVLLVLLDSQGALCGLFLYFGAVSFLGKNSTVEICFSP